ncbi:MAG: hypothetical protein IPJ69_10070 [Deltaproteobacteria bacterium]|nr:MAG: hypothetical protein IPJ69_10070 [Deltaproteobacteria bacterium]
MSQVKPFPFERLPQYSQKDVRLAQDVMACLPRLGFSQKLSTHISQLLTKELNETILIKREKLDVCIKDDLIKRLPPQGVFASVSLNPSPDKLVVELDPMLSFWAIDKLMGGVGDLPHSLRNLTEIEEGVLSFLVLKVLATLFEKSGTAARFHFRLDAIHSTHHDVVDRLEGQTAHFVSLYFRISFGKKSGFVKVYIPDSILEGSDLQSMDADQEYLEARIQNYEEILTQIWAEVGTAALTAGDVNQLESGDVILLDSHSVQLKGRQVVGMIPLRVGLGNEGKIIGRIVNDSEKIKIRVEGIQRSA